MNTLIRTILAVATVFSVLGVAARERSSLFGSRSSAAGPSRSRNSGMTSRGTSQSTVARPSFGQPAPASRSAAAAPAPRVQSVPSRVRAPAPAVTRQSAPQPVRTTTPRPTVTWDRPAAAPAAPTRQASPPPATVTRTPGTVRTAPAITRPATPSVATPRAPVAPPPATVTRTPGTVRTAPAITRPATPSVAPPRAPIVQPPAVTRTDSAAPVRTRPEIRTERTPSAGSGRETSPVVRRETPTRTATLERPAVTRATAPRIDRDAISRLPTAAERAAATRLARPDERSQIQAATRGTASLNRGGTSNALRPSGTTDSRLAYAPAARSDAGRLTTRGTSLPGTRSGAPTRTKPMTFSPVSTTSRYRDGRYSVYTPPARHTAARHIGPYRPSYHRPDRYDHHRHDDRRHHSSFYLGLSIGSGWYTPGWYGPAWYGPVYYPASGFSFSWSNRRYGLSIWNSGPVYATPYYDSWNCGGWGFSSLYYGGWHSGWYGGVSYIYNPWPVYRATYFYDPVPVVTRTETVYVTQPAAQTSVIYEEPQTYASAPAAPLSAYPAASTTAPLLPQPVAAPATQPENTMWDAAPAVARTDTETIGCFCSCHCNGQRPCICAYPCGAEYAIVREAFDLSLSFASYADTLDPETIWGAYAGFDRWAALEDDTLYADSAAPAY